MNLLLTVGIGEGYFQMANEAVRTAINAGEWYGDVHVLTKAVAGEPPKWTRYAFLADRDWSEYEWICYLDADVLVRRPLQGLWVGAQEAAQALIASLDGDLADRCGNRLARLGMPGLCSGLFLVRGAYAQAFGRAILAAKTNASDQWAMNVWAIGQQLGKGAPAYRALPRSAMAMVPGDKVGDQVTVHLHGLEGDVERWRTANAQGPWIA